MSTLATYLPQTPGYLPYWMLTAAAAGIYMGVANILHPLHNRIIYTAKPHEVSGLSGRTSGIWVVSVATVRILCAYDISNKGLYHAAMWTYLFALFHFSSEWLIFKTAKLGGGVISPFIVATSSLIWMWAQYDFYVSN